MPQGSFSGQVSAWVAKSKARVEAVYKESAQRVIAEMQRPVGVGGNMPVDTGFLRASLMAELGTPNFGLRDNPGGKAVYDAGQVSLIIASAKITDPITAVYTANYAKFVNDGARGRAPRQFVGLAAQQWPRIVDEVCREAQGRAG
jgi:hypothetical protein